MGQIKLTPLAQEDIIDIWHYIAVENKSVINADRFIDRMDAQLVFLSDNPRIGVLKPQYMQGLYQFVFGNYLIFYFPIKEGIEVVRVLHGARDLWRLFQ
ncbi:type II toxin-antitoxin system RelE/ParE family toxin [Oscillatoria amoena NRMC-F 0135]|nr:type II toxin-antitoxin system RelE/ParE family toxin [Oscillatoria amoena NRMC-F 0135]